MIPKVPLTKLLSECSEFPLGCIEDVRDRRLKCGQSSSGRWLSIRGYSYRRISTGRMREAARAGSNVAATLMASAAAIHTGRGRSKRNENAGEHVSPRHKAPGSLYLHC